MGLVQREHLVQPVADALAPAVVLRQGPRCRHRHAAPERVVPSRDAHPDRGARPWQLAAVLGAREQLGGDRMAHGADGGGRT